MALDVAFKAGRKDFEAGIQACDAKMDELIAVISEYRDAIQTLDMFIQSEDSTYDLWVQRIQENIRAASKSHAALQATRDNLQETLDKMENMGTNASGLVSDAIDAVGGVIDASIAIDAVM